LSASNTMSAGSGKKSLPNATSAVSNGVFGDDDDDDEGEEDGPPIKTPKLPAMPTIPQLATKPPPSTTTSAAPSSSSQPAAIDSNNKNTKTKKQKESTDMKEHDSQHKRSKMSTDDEPDSNQDYWLYRDIVVRVIAKDLAGGKYFRRKAVVDKLVDKYTAEVEILDSDPDARDGGDILRLDQADLETVVPKLKKVEDDADDNDSREDERRKKKKKKERNKKNPKVRILIGKYRGSKALVESLDKKKYTADLTMRLEDGDKLIRDVPYEHFSQIA
jgi:KN17 SH3-like C-terminal domain